MSGFTKAYDSIKGERTYTEVIEEPKSITETEASIQLTTNWLSSSKTQEVFEDIAKDIEALQNKAIELAVNFPSHQNPHSIINLLVRVDELKNRLKKYGSIQQR